MNKEEIVVSISCITFNHKDYIRECLDGFLMQKTNFKYEVLIHDDASIDGTSEIIREYQKSHPELIKPIIQEENQYSKGVRGMSRTFNYPRAKGKYIALCEGDDYWTDPFKLQKQVDFLETHPDYSACFTNALMVNEMDGSSQEYVKNLITGSVPTGNVISRGGGLYPTASLVFRREGIERDMFYKNLGLPGDAVLIYMLIINGEIFFDDYVSCVYRRWSGGIYSSLTKTEKGLHAKKLEEIPAYLTFDTMTNKRFHNHIRSKISKRVLHAGEGMSLVELGSYFKLLTFMDFVRLIKRKLIRK